MIMNGAIKRRLLSLERSAEVKRTATIEQNLYDVFEAMHLSYKDQQLLHVICVRNDPLTTCTPEERAVLGRFSAEFEAAFKIVSSRTRP
jgi:hypothetical protein